MVYSSEFPVFAVTADTVVLTLRHGQLCALLIRRSGSVHTGRWALPGGFVRPEESLEDAAYRELHEEAGIRPGQVQLEQLRAYGAPDRDPRPERVVSIAWVALGADLPDPHPSTDADAAEWVTIDEAVDRDLAFDHSQILADGVEWARSRLESTTLATVFCGHEFTLPDLRRVYEAVWGQALDPRNFQRKALSATGFVKATDKVIRGRGRPAVVYSRGDATRLHPPILRR